MRPADDATPDATPLGPGTTPGTDTLPEGLEDAVRTWIADDPDPETARHLTGLLELALGGSEDDPTDPVLARAARADLADRFAGRLEFGTAGLRGELGGGPNRMNRAVVVRAAAGLVRYLLDVLDRTGEQRPRVVIGYDARTGSDVFARDTAGVVTAAGGEALLLPAPLPTPVLAFAVQHLAADAGVMVTASHNPPQDNGYKVYLGGRVVTDSGRGAQIVPPHDAEIAARIDAVESVASVPRTEDGWTVLGDELLDDYLGTVAMLADPVADPTARRDLRIVLTPLHGVGGAVAERVLRDAGFTDVYVVPEQAAPDPRFPTVAFPNPEEPGAIDLALALAAEMKADLVLANDPDADRCAVALRDPRARVAGSATGTDRAVADGWRMLHGDEVGALLGQYAAERFVGPVGSAGQAGGVPPGAAPPAAVRAGTAEPTLASSIVSSRLLARIAAEHGLAHRSTLTGFKWISRVDGLLFGYEEALGYCVDPEHVRDKDGLSAALLVARLAAETKAAGRTLIGLLDDLAVRHGLHLTDQLSARFADLDRIPATMARVRSAPPARLGGSPVVTVTDLSVGSADLPPTDGLVLLAQDGTRVVVRPSGTEPKVKCYLEVVEPVGSDGDDPVGTARARARRRLDVVRADVAAALGL